METFKFNNIVQKDDQNIKTFITELKNQAASWDFVCTKDNCKMSYVDRMIKDRIILWANDKQIQQIFIKEPCMTVDEIKEYCKFGKHICFPSQDPCQHNICKNVNDNHRVLIEDLDKLVLTL
ncbi:unnamed protein product [Psylliodes chrysocephalus]|uniref:Uncharacterized protein n=1 Tax=Psylliodes chrysocephalus TaxID=3402493 RepID=A0A9P0CMY1_9CUCU|nr:unnamed protein product [Psylliodes chrysocephala]